MTKAIPTTTKKLSYHNKAQLVDWILSYQEELKLRNEQLKISEADVEGLLNQQKDQFIKPQQYLADFKKRTARNNEEIKNLVIDCKAAFTTVKKQIVSLPAFL